MNAGILESSDEDDNKADDQQDDNEVEVQLLQKNLPPRETLLKLHAGLPPDSFAAPHNKPPP